MFSISAIEHLSLPSVIEICENVFDGSRIKTLNVPNCKKINISAFEGLTQVKICCNCPVPDNCLKVDKIVNPVY